MDIEKTLKIENCRIRIRMEPGVLRIVNDLELWKLLGTSPRVYTSLLVDAAKAGYKETFQQALAISPASLIVEIWGHVYFEWLTLSVKHLLPVPWLRKKLREMTRPAHVIDCGEKAKDSNRWLWDFLAPLKGFIGFFLPRRIDRSPASTYKKEE